MTARRGIVAGLVGICVLLAAILLRSSLSVTSPAATDVDSRLESIRRAVAEEQRAREALESEVEELRGRVESGAKAPLTGETAARPAAAPAKSPTPAEKPASAEPRKAGKDVESSPLFDEEGLIAAGLDRIDTRALRERWERYELDKLDLNDRAIREGYFMTPRHGNERQALDLAFRGDVGEDGYGNYLYATGQSNRLVVREVIPNSAAAGAGLQRGDEIVRYDEASIFSTGDLTLRAAAGERGDLVPLQVVRDGRPMTLRVERGPLGAVVDEARRLPARP